MSRRTYKLKFDWLRVGFTAIFYLFCFVTFNDFWNSYVAMVIDDYIYI